MKRVAIIILGILFYTNIQADCVISTFSSNYLNNYNNADVYFVKGVKLKTIYHGIQLKVLEDFKQNLQKDTIMVWCSDGNSFRVDYASEFNDNDTLFMLITKTDLEGNDPGDLNEIPDNLETPEDYMPIHCSFSILKYSKSFLTGRITSLSQDTTVSVSFIFNELTTGINQSDSKIDINLYPNPGSSKLYITMNGDICLPATIVIYDDNGRLIQNSMSYAIEYSLNISALCKGTYFIKIIDNCNKCLINKFIKQ